MWLTYLLQFFLQSVIINTAPCWRMTEAPVVGFYRSQHLFMEDFRRTISILSFSCEQEIRIKSEKSAELQYDAINDYSLNNSFNVYDNVCPDNDSQDDIHIKKKFLYYFVMVLFYLHKRYMRGYISLRLQPQHVCNKLFLWLSELFKCKLYIEISILFLYTNYS